MNIPRESVSEPPDLDVPAADAPASAETPVDASPTDPAVTGNSASRKPGVRIGLACPDCGASGWIDLTGLNRALRCPRCSRHFMVDRRGRLLSGDEVPYVEYSCPRCGQAGKIPSVVSIRKAECGACGLPLATGPDHRLHGSKEAAQMRKAAHRDARQRSIQERLRDTFRDGDARVRPLAAGVAVLAVILLAWGAVTAVRALFDHSPETLARNFTRTCLTGEWNDAKAYLPEDAVQRADFDRWRLYYFSSILDTHRPDGDHVEVTAEALEQGPSQRVLQMMLQSQHIGTRKHKQHWRLIDGAWRFDARATLAEIDRQQSAGRR